MSIGSNITTESCLWKRVNVDIAHWNTYLSLCDRYDKSLTRDILNAKRHVKLTTHLACVAIPVKATRNNGFYKRRGTTELCNSLRRRLATPLAYTIISNINIITHVTFKQTEEKPNPSEVNAFICVPLFPPPGGIPL